MMSSTRGSGREVSVNAAAMSDVHEKVERLEAVLRAEVSVRQRESRAMGASWLCSSRASWHFIYAGPVIGAPQQVMQLPKSNEWVPKHWKTMLINSRKPFKHFR